MFSFQFGDLEDDFVTSSYGGDWKTSSYVCGGHCRFIHYFVCILCGCSSDGAFLDITLFLIDIVGMIFLMCCGDGAVVMMDLWRGLTFCSSHEHKLYMQKVERLQ